MAEQRCSCTACQNRSRVWSSGPWGDSEGVGGWVEHVGWGGSAARNACVVGGWVGGRREGQGREQGLGNREGNAGGRHACLHAAGKPSTVRCRKRSGSGRQSKPRPFRWANRPLPQAHPCNPPTTRISQRPPAPRCTASPAPRPPRSPPAKHSGSRARREARAAARGCGCTAARPCTCKDWVGLGWVGHQWWHIVLHPSGFNEASMLRLNLYDVKERLPVATPGATHSHAPAQDRSLASPSPLHLSHHPPPCTCCPRSSPARG